MALTRLANSARFATEISIELGGFADKREHASYNQQLSGDRAAAVQTFLEEQLDARKVEHTLDAYAMGEIERPQVGDTDEELKPFRRVEIVVTHVEYPEGKECGGDMLCQKHTPWKGPRPPCAIPTTKWQAKMKNISSVHVGIPKTKTGVGWTSATVEIRMAEPDADGRRCRQRFIYSGWGGGVGVEVKVGKAKTEIGTGPIGWSEDNDWSNFVTRPMLVQEFADKATLSSIGAEVGWGASFEALTLPSIDETTSPTKQVFFLSAGKGLGVGFSTDLWGKLIDRYETQRID